MFNYAKILNEDERVLKIAEHIKEISSLLGIEVTDSNKDTPYRVAKMYVREVFKNQNSNIFELDSQMKLFNNEGTTMPVTVKDIPFNSMCEHHWLPFMGTVSVSYTPNDKIIGLSKIPRVVKFFSKKPQLQERLTNEIGQYLVDLLKPKYLTVSLKATHTCVMCRGAESPSETITQFVYRGES